MKLDLTGERRIKNRIRKVSTISILTILLISIFVVYLQIGRVDAENDAGSSRFSIIQITDTQYLSESFPSLYTNLTNWIVANNADYNIKMVIHTGDIVNQGEVTYEWANANSSMSILLDAGIPYTWDAGNHDQNLTAGRSYSGTPNGGWLGSNYLAFNATYMRSKQYWVSDINDGKDTAVEFAAENYYFLVINLEFHANQTAINWMTDLINTHQNYKIIVATHSYLNGVGGYGYPGSPDTPAWENALTKILNNYPNVFLALSGHYVPVYHEVGVDAEAANNTRVGNRDEIFFNRQHVHGGQGAYAARIYTFNMTNMQVNVSTYAIDTQTWLTDAYNQFSFSVSLNPALTALAAPTSLTIQTRQSAVFVVTASGGATPYTYQWYQGTNPLKDQTKPQLSLTATEYNEGGEFPYHCTVTDANGKTVESNNVSLKVTDPEKTQTPTQQASTSLVPSPEQSAMQP